MVRRKKHASESDQVDREGERGDFRENPPHRGSGRVAPRCEEEEELVSLGSLFYEPVWLFYRVDRARSRGRLGEQS